jgi:hypothetical protein
MICIAQRGDVDRKCTFCKIRLEREMAQRLGRDVTVAEREGLIVPDEDRPHISWNCPMVASCVQEVHRRFWGTNNDVGKKDFLLGKDMGTVEGTVLYIVRSACKLRARRTEYKSVFFYTT